MNKMIEKFHSFSITSRNVAIASIVIFLSQIPSYYGEDIVNARNNFLTGSKTDFWGGISTIFYSYIPNFGFRWQIWLALFQISLTTCAVLILVRNLSTRFLVGCIEFFVVYISLMFSVQMTRDSLMFSLLIFGLALLVLSPALNRRKFSLVSGLILITLGMSLRPWLSISVIPIVLLLVKKSNPQILKRTTTLLIILIALMPGILEITSTKMLSLKKSFPEQQVMIMDAAATYCFSNSDTSGEKAKEFLSNFTKIPGFENRICQFYRPDTWQSLTASTSTSSKHLKSDFWIIPAGSNYTYSKLTSSWVDLVVHDPVTYFQNKLLFAGKLLIGSDMRSFSLLSSSDLISMISATVRTPYEFVIAAHLISIFACLMILLSIPTWRSITSRRSEISIDVHSFTFIISLVSWLICSSIAYIGSNGRYTYSITLITLVFTITRNQNTAK